MSDQLPEFGDDSMESLLPENRGGESPAVESETGEEGTTKDLPRLDDAGMRRLIDDYLSDRIFTDRHLPPHDGHLMAMVFMPIMFGALSDVDTKQLGLIYSYRSNAGPRGINGYPIFDSVYLVHKDDWKICARTIEREHVRRQTIVLLKEEE